MSKRKKKAPPKAPPLHLVENAAPPADPLERDPILKTLKWVIDNRSDMLELRIDGLTGSWATFAHELLLRSSDMIAQSVRLREEDQTRLVRIEQQMDKLAKYVAKQMKRERRSHEVPATRPAAGIARKRRSA